MDAKIKIGILALLSIGILISAIASTIHLETEPIKGFNGIDLNLETYYCTEFKHVGSDTWENLGCRHNVFTDVGRDYVEGLLGGTLSGNTNYLALGNGTTPTTASTTLNTEQVDCGLARVLGNYYNLNTGWWEVNTTFTYTCSFNRVVNTTASFNATSAGTMLAGGTITTVTFTTNGDQLRLRHNNSIS